MHSGGGQIKSMLETPLNMLLSLVVVGKIVIRIYNKLVSQVGRQQLIFYSVKKAQNTEKIEFCNKVNTREVNEKIVCIFMVLAFQVLGTYDQ